MKIKFIFPIFLILCVGFLMSFQADNNLKSYKNYYFQQLDFFKQHHVKILSQIKKSNLNSTSNVENLKTQISEVRLTLKAIDFWLRYLEPVAYKQINGPLPVEWETEVHEKHEKPYKRLGSGFTLALLYLEEPNPNKDTLLQFFKQSSQALQVFEQDSITTQLNDYQHFVFANRLHLLNLAAIYTTGFECSDTAAIVPELLAILESTHNIYLAYNQTFIDKNIPAYYLLTYLKMIDFVKNQPKNYSQFNHFVFIKDYVNVLFAYNQKWIVESKASSKSFLDYALNKNNQTIFSKNVYRAQNAKGIFLRVNDENELLKIKNMGKLLFYDPILSKNNQRSCASCHFPTQFFTDTTRKAAPHFSKTLALPRNTPSLINANANHLLMHDGKHISLQNQCKDVITNPNEMASDAKEVVEKVMNCKKYKQTFSEFLKHTPQETKVTFDHIASAITLYYNDFSQYDSDFDDAMNHKTTLNEQSIKGFNLFMSKAQCATCHFVPQFNGTKPPYTGSEFEVLGTPADKNYKNLSADLGRFDQNPAIETKNAFRTSTLRNSAKTKPYMHNGVFDTLDEVIDFYNTGGGAAHGLLVDNQTLSSDSLHLSSTEISHLKAFIHSLNEHIVFDTEPKELPKSNQKNLNSRKIGGEY